MAWAIYLVGGLATIGILFVASLFLALQGVAALIDLMRGSEVEDDTS